MNLSSDGLCKSHIFIYVCALEEEQALVLYSTEELMLMALISQQARTDDCVRCDNHGRAPLALGESDC